MKKFIFTLNFIPQLTFGMNNENEKIIKNLNINNLNIDDLNSKETYKLANECIDNYSNKFYNLKILNKIKNKYKNDENFKDVIEKFDKLIEEKSIFLKNDFIKIDNSPEYKIKEIISKDIKYISEIFNYKFLYDFEDIFNLKEQCVIFKTIRNILLNYLEIEDRFKYIFNDKDNRYFLICNFNDKDKTYIDTIERVLKKNNIKIDNSLYKEYINCKNININKNNTITGKTVFLRSAPFSFYMKFIIYIVFKFEDFLLIDEKLL